MAGNFGKYIDRSPVICAAGVVSGDPANTVAATFKQYRTVDEIEALKHDAKIWKEDDFVPPRRQPPIQNANFKGTNTEISAVLRPPVLTRYQQLIGDLKDTPYTSYWNAEIGKVRDPTPGLPAGMNPVEVTFGEPTKRGLSVKELVNPSKSHYQVLRESQIGHDLYRNTHNDYNPSERIDRNYKKPPYNPEKRFGEKSAYDPRGIWVQCACDWYEKERLTHVNHFESDVTKRTRHQLGKGLAPNNNINCVPKGYPFGYSPKQDIDGVEDLLKDPNLQPCPFKRNYYEWLKSLNQTRTQMKKRCFDIEDLYKKAVYMDKEKIGTLPLDDFYHVCSSNQLTLPKELEHLCSHLKYIQNGRIDYRKCLDLIDINKDPKDIKRVDDIPNENKYYMSTYQAANCDYLFINNNDLPPAGVPSIRHDLPRPVAPAGGCRADIENLGNETSAKGVLNPSIYTNYGLTYRDFFMPRSDDVIRTLFERLGYNFPGDNFAKLWDTAVKIDGTGQVCVDTFKRLLQAQCSSLKLRVDEKQIECEKAVLQ